MVFIHGGGFVMGSGALAMLTGDNLVAMAGGDIVYVSINYRLGALGFLAADGICEPDRDNNAATGGANGLFDQIQASERPRTTPGKGQEGELSLIHI